ncbi:MAG: HD domain-containing protein [Solirubrobacterales bacterium]|nr:HD domain-containing protein [Solirubrobacterales bacterium]
MLIRDLAHGTDLDQVLLVRDVQRKQRPDGSEVVRLVLADRTGGVPAIVTEDLTVALELCRAGEPVHVTGRFEVHPRYGRQIEVAGLGPAVDGTFDPAQLVDGPPRDADQMEADLRELVATIHDPHLRALLDAVFGEGSPTWAAYRVAPAAKLYHQAYVHGLLEHSLSVAQAVSAISATFPGIDREVAVTGALLHDIGKLEAYTAEAPIDLTDAGRLQGEIPLGYYRVRRLIEELVVDGEPFPAAISQAVLHIILSHHGTLEHGSPVVPCTREATLVHFMDNLGGRLGSFDRLEKGLAPGSAWSSYDRALGSGAYFGPIRAEDRRREAA